MSVVGVIQARMSSSRLPGKVLLPLAGIPVLHHVIHRLRAARSVEGIIVATSEAPDDQAVVEACARWGVACVRGALDDVLDRFCVAIRASGATTVARVPADKPLLDPDLIDRLVELALSERLDYATNMGAGWPDDRSCLFGFEMEAISADALLRANASSCTRAEREHVTPYIGRPDHGFRVRRIVHPNPLAPIEARITLDTVEDYEVLTAIYDALWRDDGTIISLADVRDFLRGRPDLVTHNVEVVQRGAT